MMKTDRPLSPHLQIYRLPLTAVLSILHRMTGALLGLGLVVMVVWLAALASDAATYQKLHDLFAAWTGRVLLVAWSAALYFHLCNGVRHLIWDLGLGFDSTFVDRSALGAILITILLTAATWIMVCVTRGAL